MDSPRLKVIVRRCLFWSGLVIAAAAWFVDKAQYYPPLLRALAPDYVAVQGAFKVLDEDEKAVLSLDNPGAHVLLKWWKPQPSREIIEIASGIGRSTGIYNVISGIHRYELRLLTNNNSEMLKDYIWTDVDAKKQMQDRLDRETTNWGLSVLVIGLILTAASYYWDHRTDWPSLDHLDPNDRDLIQRFVISDADGHSRTEHTGEFWTQMGSQEDARQECKRAIAPYLQREGIVDLSFGIVGIAPDCVSHLVKYRARLTSKGIKWIRLLRETGKLTRLWI
jgi:hypothetical protein